MELPTNLNPDEASPAWMNKADNTWQLTAATLVGLQSIPGLVILYGSMVKKKWAVNSAFMAFYAFAAVLVCWVGWGFRMSFGGKLVVFLGKPAVALDEKFLLGQAFLGLFPTATMVFFQGVFAGITLILVAVLWCPDGWLAKLGVIDYSGGFVVHLSAGVAGFTAAFWVGPRTEKDRERFAPPNNIILMLAGAGLLWMAGVVQGWAAIIMGIVSGSVPWYTMMVLHDKVKILRHVDDPMAVFHTHAVAGTLGGILTGLFAVPKLCRIFYMVLDWEKYIGLLYGLQSGRTSAGFRQIGLQLGGVLFVIGWNVVVTSSICLLIRLIVPLRLDHDELQIGYGAVHGEEAFALIDKESAGLENAEMNRAFGFENSKMNVAFDVEENSSMASRSISEFQLV
ncbi:Ammonium transporter [Parasponia andersonii]|uniref:Ammonium transporter n=1 Tax=Parasponia andersonii TaxID=3476 RepID=A0A2P5DKQ9_PARAD|nr:Ammonium transporter [Parasponia andersonii]